MLLHIFEFIYCISYIHIFFQDSLMNSMHVCIYLYILQYFDIGTLIVVFKAQPMYAFGDLLAWLIAYGEVFGKLVWNLPFLFLFVFLTFLVDIRGKKSYKIQDFRSVHLFFSTSLLLCFQHLACRHDQIRPDRLIYGVNVGFQGAEKVNYWTMRDLDWAGLSKQLWFDLV